MRDVRLWHQFNTLPVAGGMDDQPLERLTQMQFAERVRRMIDVQNTSDNWAHDMQPFQDLVDLFAEHEEDGR